MARFKFRLATLLKLREAVRDERRAELAQAYRADDVLNKLLEQTRTELNSLEDQCRKAAGPGTIDIDRLIEAQRYEIILKLQQRHLNEQRGRLAAEIERRRVALLAANREVRVLEKLRERQLEQYNQAENRLDIKRLDEVARLQTAAAEEVV
ncbi:MAG: flagellar export protein FliJ [Thermoguttaceae bacterium]|jgi:flagellar FliJ protein